VVAWRLFDVGAKFLGAEKAQTVVGFPVNVYQKNKKCESWDFPK
jgi:hypothetical protein